MTHKIISSHKNVKMLKPSILLFVSKKKITLESIKIKRNKTI